MDQVDFSFARTSGLSTSFLKIAVDNYILHKNKLKEYDNLKLNKTIKIDNNYEVGQHFMISVIFCSMFMESYIYDFAARNKGDNYTNKYLDHLKLISKWVIIPKIVSGIEIDTSRKSFEVLGKLIKIRNKLIHWKSKNGSYENIEKSNLDKIYDLIDLEEVFSSIKDIFKQLDKGQKNKVHNIYLRYIDEKKIIS